MKTTRRQFMVVPVTVSLLFLASCISTGKIPASTAKHLSVSIATRKLEYKLSEPIVVRLVMTNLSDKVVIYDDQQVGVNNPFRVVNSKMKELPFLAGSVMTVGGPKIIQPRQAVVLLPGYDLGQFYPLNEPGQYKVNFRGTGRTAETDEPIPPSIEIEIEVR